LREDRERIGIALEREMEAAGRVGELRRLA
jgi:hypothetical protein